MADDNFDTGDLFQDPEGFYPEEEPPTFAEHQMLSGQTVRVRLVGSHPLYANLLWNAGRTSAHYIEEHTASLIRDKDVLEIGAAAGVPSIVSAIQGARTVVMTDYPDPELVTNMQHNADLSAHIIPPAPASRRRLYVEGYKWGSPVEPLLAHLPSTATPAAFDVLIMADVVYSHREHGNLVKTMQQTLKKNADAVALVIFTPYEPWLLPQTERFFPLAEAGGFTVTKIFEKLMEEVLFEDDPGVSVVPVDRTMKLTIDRMKNCEELFSDTSFDGGQSNWRRLHRKLLSVDLIPSHFMVELEQLKQGLWIY